MTVIAREAGKDTFLIGIIQEFLGLLAVLELNFERTGFAMVFVVAETLLIRVVQLELLVRPGQRPKRDTAGVDGPPIAAGFGDLEVMVSLVLELLGRRRDTDADTGSGDDVASTFPTLEIFDEEGGLGIVGGTGQLGGIFPTGITVSPASGDGDGTAVVGNGVGRFVCPSREVSGQVSSSHAASGCFDEGI